MSIQCCVPLIRIVLYKVDYSSRWDYSLTAVRDGENSPFQLFLEEISEIRASDNVQLLETKWWNGKVWKRLFVGVHAVTCYCIPTANLRTITHKHWLFYDLESKYTERTCKMSRCRLILRVLHYIQIVLRGTTTRIIRRQSYPPAFDALSIFRP